MSEVILLLDVNYLSWRAAHTTGSLTHDGLGTGVAFGVLRDIESQTQIHSATKLVLAFDSRVSKRKEICPGYKGTRNEGLSEEELKAKELVYAQIERLRTQLLPLSGYRNVVTVEGYEADDVIAKYVQDISSKDKAIIVSADQDLWQCVGKNVSCFNPTKREFVTGDSFRAQFGIDPLQWAHVKALAGCGTDEVEGIKGIGEASAAGWFSGKLKSGKKYDLISENLHFIEKNLPLVKLPFPGIEVPELVEDEVTEQSKLEVQVLLGIRSGRTSQRAKDKQQSLKRTGFDFD